MLLGMELGNTEGVDDGSVDGVTLGSPLGVIDGLTVWILLGSRLGVEVGVIDGSYDGIKDGYDDTMTTQFTVLALKVHTSKLHDCVYVSNNTKFQKKIRLKFIRSTKIVR